MANPTNELRLELQVTGTNANTWGEIANVNFRLIEDAISGIKEIATSGGTVTLSTANAAGDYASSEDQARYAVLKITGNLTSNVVVVVPAVSKIYLVWNATTGDYTVTFKVGSSTGTAVTQGKRTLLLSDGSDVHLAITDPFGGYAHPALNQTWLKAQRGVFVALTSSSASIAVNLELANNFNHTLTENTTLAAPSNVVAGQSGVIHFTQHGGTAKTLAFNSFWQFGIDAEMTLTETLSGTGIMSYIVNPDAASATCTLVNTL